VEYDAELTLADITSGLFAWIARLAPFGIANPEPIFLTRNATLAAPARVIKEKHICLQLTQSGPRQTPAPTISVLGWSRSSCERSAWPARCARLGLAEGSTVDILYRLRQNTGPYANGDFSGLELELCDLRSAVAPVAEALS
jgi:single-stranded-DNA-specific exonuclease